MGVWRLPEENPGTTRETTAISHHYFFLTPMEAASKAGLNGKGCVPLGANTARRRLNFLFRSYAGGRRQRPPQLTHPRCLIEKVEKEIHGGREEKGETQQARKESPPFRRRQGEVCKYLEANGVSGYFWVANKLFVVVAEEEEDRRRQAVRLPAQAYASVHPVYCNRT